MVIVGAKGFAKEVLEVFHQKGETKGIYFFDNISSDLPHKLFGEFNVLRTWEELKEVFSSDPRFALGIGGPRIRHMLTQKCQEAGGELYSIISPLAQIGHYGVTVGLGCSIMTGAIITNDIRIGEGSLINLNCTIGHDSSIGKFCELSPCVNISGNCTVGDFCNIGTGAILLPKVKLGNNVVVGAGAVVTKDIADNSLIVGIPAKAIKQLPSIP